MDLNNSIATRLRAGQRVSGISVGTPYPPLIQMCAYAGFDFVVIDNEHGPASVETVGEAIRTAHGAGLAPVVRTFEPDIGRLLDAGAVGIQVPLVETAGQARRIVSACRYPPLGSRSVAFSTPAARYGFGDRNVHVEESNQAIAVILMIETSVGLSNLDDILAVEGIDAICVGPTDMSYSLGVPGEGKHPKVVEAVERCVQTCRRRGVAVGANAFSGIEHRQQVEMGMTYHTMMMTFLLGKALSDALAVMRSA